jgi:putative transposase
MRAFYDFPKAHWKHLRTSNVIESNFDPIRARTNVCKRMRSAESATYLVWALMVRRRERWRRFNGYMLLRPSASGADKQTCCVAKGCVI